MALIFRTLTALDDDIETANVLLVSVYETPRSRAAELRRALALQPDGWWLVERDGETVGVGGAVDYGPFASVGLMAVRSDLQRQGVGAALLHHILGWLDARGCPSAILSATDAGAALYRAHGFLDDGRIVVYGWGERDDRTPPTIMGEDVVVVVRLGRDELAATARFDAAIFGADRGSLLEAAYDDDPTRAFLARNAAGAIVGFLFAQQRILGPYCAATPAAASALLKGARALHYEDGPIAIVHDGNTAADVVMRRHGLTARGGLAAMRRGPAPRRDPAKLYGEAAWALG